MNRFGLNPENPNFYRAISNRYRFKIRVGPPRTKVEEIPGGTTEVEFHRKGKSHRGISARREITALAAVGADQDFLDEIGQLTALEQLDLRFPMRAPDLTPLANLRQLRVLHIDSPSAVRDFSPISELPQLEVLTIENAQHLFSIDWLRPLTSHLITLGLEGSISKDQKIESLAPLEGSSIEALFMVSATLRDKDLSPLETCPNLVLFNCARLAPRAEYQRLETVKPEILCSWFHADRWD